MRLDKYLSQMSIGTRSEVKKLIKSGRVFVNGIVVKKPEQKVKTEDEIVVDGETVQYEPYQYYMLNKPAGYVSATVDEVYPTVVSLIKENRKEDLFPVGRLDKDTEGLLLLTNDGELAHNLLSPRKHVWKTYLVKVQGKIMKEDVEILEKGVDIGEDKLTLPSEVSDVRYEVEAESSYSWLRLAIREGKFHQVKRMLAAVGKPVIYLKRESMGSIRLDDNLELGAYRKLTEQEVEMLLVKTNTRCSHEG